MDVFPFLALSLIGFAATTLKKGQRRLIPLAFALTAHIQLAEKVVRPG
jgi:hypothetical protein